MPELPEVETVVRGLRSVFVGRYIDQVVLKRPDLRFPFPQNFVSRLQGCLVQSIDRRAKYICMHLSSGETLLWHLGMSGRIVLDENESVDKHDHVFIHLRKEDTFASQNSSSDKATQIVRYRDPRRFGFMDLVPSQDLTTSKLINHLGPEPLSDDFDEDYLRRALESKTVAIKTAIMDAKVVVGVGNIYASEALFRSRIHPETAAKTVKKIPELVQAIKEVLEAAIQSGGSTLRDYVRPDGELGYFQHTFFVYGKAGEMCQVCQKDRIQQIKQAGRSTFFCGTCQEKE